MVIEQLRQIMERGEGVVCRRFAHEDALHFARILDILPMYDRRGALNYTVICADRAGCRYTVKPEWLYPIEGGGIIEKKQE